MKPHPIVASLAARTSDLDIPWGQLAEAISAHPRAVYAWRTGQAAPYFASAVAWAEHVGLILAAVDERGRILAVGADIPGRLTEFRKRLGLSQREVAERRHMAPRCVSALERGSYRPTLRTVAEHLTALGLRLVLLRPAALGVAA